MSELNDAINLLKNSFETLTSATKFFYLATQSEYSDSELITLKTEIESEEKFQETLNSWFASEGDKTLRLDYDLHQGSVVFDVGGYLGTWATSIFCRYDSNIFIFEPVQDFHNIICNLFKHNKKIQAFNIGLSNKTFATNIGLLSDGSSAYKEAPVTELVMMKNIDEFIKEHSIERIDLMKINIEGGEYDLLKGLLDSGNINIINNIQVQFHNFHPNAVALRNELRERLKKTHEQTYCFEFVWENWRKK